MPHTTDVPEISDSLELVFQSGHFSVQGLPQFLLLLQISENFAPDSLQALHLALALIHLTLQGLHAEGQLGTERQGGGGGVSGEQRRRRRRRRLGGGLGEARKCPGDQVRLVWEGGTP